LTNATYYSLVVFGYVFGIGLALGFIAFLIDTFIKWREKYDR